MTAGSAMRARRVLGTLLVVSLSLGACRSASPARLADFTSDGCSMFPDGNYVSCCYVHDVVYWPGGTSAARETADQALRACVREITSNQTLAEAMYRGVRVGGIPELPTHYRWGYGWPYPYRKDYAPFTPEEQQQVAEKTQKLCKSLRPNPATGGFVVVISGRDGEISAAQARQICPGP